MQKIWLKHYQPGVPSEINPQEYLSLVDLFLQSCKQFKNKTAYTNMGVRLSYEDLDQLSQHFATYLQQLGLRKGSRVAIMLPNLLQYPVALFGILRAGYTVVNTNPLYTPDEVVHQMNDAEAEVLIVLANFAHTIEKALPQLSSIKHIIVTEIGIYSLSLKEI